MRGEVPAGDLISILPTDYTFTRIFYWLNRAIQATIHRLEVSYWEEFAMWRRRSCIWKTRRIATQRRLTHAFLLSACLTILAVAGEQTATSPKAAVISIRGEINDVLTRSLERRLAQAKADGVKLVIFELHTPGGLVTSALDISKMIKKLPDEGLRTAAWVNDQAYSAGALIAVAAQEIIMSTGSSIGDCAPIMITPMGGLESLGDAERAKAESPILQEFRDSAVRNNYDPILCQAMVTVGAEVWWLENATAKIRQFVSGDRKKELLDNLDPDRRDWSLVRTYVDPKTGREIDIEQPVVSATALLTMSEGEAVAFGFAKAIVSDLRQVAEHFGLAAEPPRLEASGWEKFAIWLNSPLVRGILFVVMLLGAYIEFQSPGLLVPGITALVALGIFLGAPYAAGLADIWTIILLVLGIILLGVEIFVIPGFGIVGVSGIILILISFVASFVPAEPGVPAFAWPTLQTTWNALRTGIVVLSSSIIIAITGMMLLAKILPTLPFGRGLVLTTPAAGAVLAGAAAPAPGDIAQIGDVGIVTGDLRPGGLARFGHKIVDVCSQGEYVEVGRRVQVIERDGFKIVVRPLPEDLA